MKNEENATTPIKDIARSIVNLIWMSKFLCFVKQNNILVKEL